MSLVARVRAYQGLPGNRARFSLERGRQTLRLVLLQNSKRQTWKIRIATIQPKWICTKQLPKYFSWIGCTWTVSSGFEPWSSSEACLQFFSIALLLPVFYINAFRTQRSFVLCFASQVQCPTEQRTSSASLAHLGEPQATLINSDSFCSERKTDAI